MLQINPRFTAGDLVEPMTKWRRQGPNLQPIRRLTAGTLLNPWVMSTEPRPAHRHSPASPRGVVEPLDRRHLRPPARAPIPDSTAGLVERLVDTTIVNSAATLSPLRCGGLVEPTAAAIPRTQAHADTLGEHAERHRTIMYEKGHIAAMNSASPSFVAGASLNASVLHASGADPNTCPRFAAGASLDRPLPRQRVRPRTPLPRFAAGAALNLRRKERGVLPHGEHSPASRRGFVAAWTAAIPTRATRAYFRDLRAPA